MAQSHSAFNTHGLQNAGAPDIPLSMYEDLGPTLWWDAPLPLRAQESLCSQADHSLGQEEEGKQGHVPRSPGHIPGSGSRSTLSFQSVCSVYFTVYPRALEFLKN